MAKFSTGTKLGMGFALCLLVVCLVVIYKQLGQFEYACGFSAVEGRCPLERRN